MGINEIAIESVEPLRLLPLEDLCCAIMSDLEGLLAPEDNVMHRGAAESTVESRAPN